MSCGNTHDKDKENEQANMFSDTAVKYIFDANNMLKLRKITIDKEVIVYAFEKGSRCIDALKTKKGVKTWIKSLSEEHIAVSDWEIIENEQEDLWVIHYKSEKIDFEYGLTLSNCFKDDGYSLDFSCEDMIVIAIINTNNPSIYIDDIRNYRYDQYYKDGKWSEIEETYLGEVPQ